MKSKRITFVAIATAVMIVLSQIAIPLPFTPIPFTMSFFAIFLMSAVLSPGMAVMSQVVYLFIGAIGIPVFAKFAGGFGIIMGPTGGFLMAYPIMALVISLLCKKQKFVFSLIGMLAAIVICYSFGAIWFCFVAKATIGKALAMTVIPYIIPDLIKMAIALVIVTGPAGKRIRSQTKIN